MTSLRRYSSLSRAQTSIQNESLQLPSVQHTVKMAKQDFEAPKKKCIFVKMGFSFFPLLNSSALVWLVLNYSLFLFWLIKSIHTTDLARKCVLVQTKPFQKYKCGKGLWFFNRLINIFINNNVFKYL